MTAQSTTTPPSSLAEANVLVVGASSGIGRAAAERLLAAGARVVVSARRLDRLTELVAASENGHAIAGDVARASSCHDLVQAAVAQLGHLDVVLYAAGTGPLKRIEKTGADDWSEVFATNVIGPHEIVRAALPVLTPGAVVAVISTEGVARPFPGMGAYAASKAALDVAIRAWRTEHPTVRFCCVTQGATAPTEFGRDFDGEVLGDLLQDWARLGMVTEGLMDTEHVASVLVTTMGALVENPSVAIEQMTLRGPFPVAGASEPFEIDQRPEPEH